MKTEQEIRVRLKEFREWNEKGLIENSDKGFDKALEWCLE